MMRSIFVARFSRAAFEDYRVTIEKAERCRAIARRERPMKTSHDRDDFCGIPRSRLGLHARCGNGRSQCEYECGYHGVTSIAFF